MSWNVLQPPHDNPHARTHVTEKFSSLNPYLPANMLVQLKLYHWCRTEFVNGVPIAGLHHHLFFDYPQISKRHLGLVMRETTRYDCRKLKAKTKTNPKACVMYVWNEEDDLRYGLEWMMSMWAYCLDGISVTDLQQTPKNEWHETTAAVFSNLARVDGDGLYGDYIYPALEHDFPLWEKDQFKQKPDWFTLWAKYGWTDESTIPSRSTEEFGPLRSLL